MTPPRTIPAQRGPLTPPTESLLRATLDATADGILVVDLEGRIVLFNTRFAKMWKLSAKTLESRDDLAALAEAVSQVRDPEGFMARVADLYGKPAQTSFDLIELTDGRSFERYSRPQFQGARIVGRVWSFRDATDRINTEKELRASEARFRRIFEESRSAIYLSSLDGVLLEANPAARELFGLDPDDVPGVSTLEFYDDPSDRGAFRERVHADGLVHGHPVRLRSRDGRVMDCLLTSSVRRDDEGTIIGYQGIVEDVTKRLEVEQALQASERKFRSLIEGAQDTITIIDQNGTILFESPSVERVLGWTPEEMIGQNVFDFIHPEDRVDTVKRFQRILKAATETATMDLRFRCRDASWRTLEAVGRNLLHDPEVGGVIVNARDITERKEAEAQLLYDAFHDKLTRLPNRALFTDRLNQFIQRAKRKDAAPFSVLFLDLDRFKVVNDSLGHIMGDQLLVAIARRLRDCLRPGDTVARVGGDEFTMLLDDANRDEAEHVAERIQEALGDPFQLGDQELFATVSLGIATSSEGYGDAEEMIRDADLAMYRAKDQGRARWEVFASPMRTEAVGRLELEMDLRRALEREEFSVHYQPIVGLGTGTLQGFEALVRWNHPQRGLLLPAAFLQAAEDTRLIIPLGQWVMGEVCRQISTWSHPDSGLDPLPVHVNVSAHQLASPDLVDHVEGAVEAAKTPAGLLHLELTESTMMENAEATVRTFRRLRDLRVELSIDDFGTGYSSLSYLHRFPTESVKIDRSFIARMGPRGRHSDIVRTIIDLARDLSMRVVAEGIETEAQAAALRAMRCDGGQGYLFSKPISAEEATQLILDEPTW